jgi:hypothetical protein
MQHVHNQMSDQQSDMNITAPYAHTITTYDSQLLNFAANKFLSQQPTYRLGCWRWSCDSCLRVGDCEWRLSYIRSCVIGPCWALVLPRLMGHPTTIRNSGRKQKRSIHVFGGTKPISFPFPPMFSYFHTISASYHFHFIVSHIFWK